jgi:phosphopantothenoylcysteine decarboxylase/phosphopantothenate--cysteine ligase
MPRLLLGVSGGIAAYKALEFVRLATDAGHAVRVVMSENALRFVGAASFVGLTGAPVLVSEFERDPLRGSFPGDPPPAHDPLSHLALVQNADLYLIAPASANTLAKLAHGLADNLLTSAALAADCPLLVAPAMNNRMWEHAATAANVALLRGRGVVVIDPGAGRLASAGEHGVGRLAEPAQLLAACTAALATSSSWQGRKLLVTAGGTREPIDSVRFLGNRSSGRMGFAVAAAAAARGAEVVVVAANVTLERPPGVRYLDVSTTAELAAACEAEFDSADVLVMCAAVADYRAPGGAGAAGSGKLARSEHLTLELEGTPDIVAGLAKRRRAGQTIVGFAADHGDEGLERARAKRVDKQLDLIVFNDVGDAAIGFDAAENAVTIIGAQGDQQLSRAAKPLIAGQLLDAIEELHN